MDGLSLAERNTLGALLDTQSQETVMAKIPQFFRAETDNLVRRRKRCRRSWAC